MIGIQTNRSVIKSVTWGIFFGSFLARRTFISAAQMQRVRSDGLGGRGVTFIPSSGSYKNVVVWMHGLGDTADGWASLMPSLGLSETKFILPTADNKPISINGGMAMPAWSDIYGLDERAKEDKVGFDESKARIDRIIQAEVDKGIEPKRVVIAGFSQGGALAFHTALRSAHSVGGCIGLSTWVPFHAEYPTAISPAAANLKILQVHGDEDMVVSYRWGERSHKALKQWFTTHEPEFVTIEGMGHSSDPDETRIVQRFLKTIFEQ